MSSPYNNELSELIRFISDKNYIADDIRRTFMSMEHVSEKYLDRIRCVAESQKRLTKEKPGKEITLLKAIKNYAPKENRRSIDNVIRLLMLFNTSSSIHHDLGRLSQNNMSIMEERQDTPALPESALMLADLLLNLALFSNEE